MILLGRLCDSNSGHSWSVKEYPVKLQIVGEIRAGESAAGKKVTKGTAIRIMTRRSNA
jgi:molybdopterin biosynthesis enzyme